MNTRTTIEKLANGNLLVTITELISGNEESIDIKVMIRNDPQMPVHEVQREAVHRAQQLLQAWLQAAN